MNGAEDTEMSTVPEEVCLFKWVARKECEQAAADSAASADTLITRSEPAVSVTPRGEGVIPLTPVGAKAGTGESDSSGPGRVSLPAAAATTGVLTGAVAAAAQPAPCLLIAPHILDMLASRACTSHAATCKSGYKVALIQAADAPASPLKEEHDCVLPLPQRLAADVSVSVQCAVLEATIALIHSPCSSGPTDSAEAKGHSDVSWAKVWARIVLPLVQNAEPFEAAISEVSFMFTMVYTCMPPMHAKLISLCVHRMRVKFKIKLPSPIYFPCSLVPVAACMHAVHAVTTYSVHAHTKSWLTSKSIRQYYVTLQLLAQVAFRLFTPAKDINLSPAEPSQCTISSVRVLRPFLLRNTHLN